MMGWVFPRRGDPPARVPHEDPKVELRLQRIIGARERVGRAVVSITDYQEEIAELLKASRAMSDLVVQVGMSSAEDRILRQISLNEQRIKTLIGEIRTLEDSIDQARELIQAVSEDLTADDLRHLS